MIETHHIDCMEYMKSIPNKAFNLAIVDPPYGIGEGGGDKKRGSKIVKGNVYEKFHGEDTSPPSNLFFEELQRVSHNQIIWGANHFSSNFMSSSPCWIVWNKCNEKTDFADCELAYTSFKTAVRKFDFMWNGMMQGKNIEEGTTQQGNKKLNEKRIHPTQKPVALYKWLLKNYAKEGDKILDTHLGSGSIAIACHDMNFDLTACELSEHYFTLANNRIAEHQKQLRLF